ESIHCVNTCLYLKRSAGSNVIIGRMPIPGFTARSLISPVRSNSRRWRAGFRLLASISGLISKGPEVVANAKGLLLRDAEVALLGGVEPGAGYGLAVDFSLDDVVNCAPAIALGVEFEGDGSRFRLE